MKKLDFKGKLCPLPVIETRKAIVAGAKKLEVEVDNQIAVENLEKLAAQLHFVLESEQKSASSYLVKLAEDKATLDQFESASSVSEDLVIQIDSDQMGEGDSKLGETLLRGYIYALSELDQLPKTMLFYNRGVFLTCKGSAVLEDLAKLEAEGVEILSCGLCLNFYEIAASLEIGSSTNMYEIARILSEAKKIIKP